MSIDIKELARQRLSQITKKGNEHVWKPKEGETVIRIVPRKDNPSDPFIQLYFHYHGNKTRLSPISYGERDPFAEFSDALIGEGQLSKDEFKEAKKFAPVMRTYVPVVVRGEESAGIKYFAFGKKIYEQILTIIADEDYGDITDPKTGHDIKVAFTPKEKSATGFADTQIMVKPKSTPLTDDAALLKRLLTEQADLLEGFERYTYDELKDVLAKLLAPAPEIAGPPKTAPAAKAATDDEWATPAAKSESSEASKPSSSVEAEFEAIFNKK